MERRAAVVGAGIAGLTTAVGLRRRGWHVEVLERNGGINTVGAALGLWPEAQRGLEELEVLGRLGQSAVPYRDAWIRSPAGHRLAPLPLERIESSQGRPVVLVPRPVLMAALLDACSSEGVAPVRTSISVEPVTLLDDGFHVVVGADGINSKARSHVAPGAGPPRNLRTVAWRGQSPGHAGSWGEVWGPGVLAGVTPGGPDTTNWYVAVRDRAAVSSFQELVELVAHWPDPLPHVLARTAPDDVLQHVVHDLPDVPVYARGRVALVGDAAHAMAPSLGQGACQAVLDALALVRALDGHRDIETALRHFDRERRPVGRRFVRGSRLLLRTQTAGALLAGPRNALMRLTPRGRPATAAGVATTADRPVDEDRRSASA